MLNSLLFHGNLKTVSTSCKEGKLTKMWCRIMLIRKKLNGSINWVQDRLLKKPVT